MEAAFISFQQQHRLVQKHDRLAVAVSGGLDSMVLTHLYLETGFSFEVLHVNFQLRGAESDADEVFVTEFCAAHQLRCRVHRVDTKMYATQHRLSIQLAARQLRYAWFAHLLEHDFSKIATAHHQTDAAETFFINLFRGTGISGLTGIPVEKDGIVRPLLFATRQEIDAYAAAHTVLWREDSSNQSNTYLRNHLRHDLAPVLTNINPAWQQTLASTQARLRAAEHALEREIARWKSTWTQKESGDWVIPVASFSDWPEPAAWVWEAVKPFGFSFAVCEQLLKSVGNLQSGKRFESATHCVWVDRDVLILAVKKEPADYAVLIPEISETPGSYEGFGSSLLVMATETAFGGDRDEIHVDADRLDFPLTWRTWQPGDRFQPLGMTGFKKVSDFLIDEKIPLSEKAFVTVLETKGEIVWVVGHRLDNRFKVTGRTTKQINIRWLR
jgi:tRNA(Ile)-lysidine synthase